MQRPDAPEDEDPRSRPSSRRNSGSLSRRSSKKEKDSKKTATTASSTNTTPKKQVKPVNFDFCVTGKPLLKKCDRASSLPGYHRRPSSESIKKRAFESPKRAPTPSQASRSRETSLEDDMSLDLSQVSDFEDTISKYGIQKKFSALATSTPRSFTNFQKPRSASLQSQMQMQKTFQTDNRKAQKADSRQSNSTYSSSRDSNYKTSTSSTYRYGVNTELDYSSVSPEYSGQSSTDLSPKNLTRETELAMSPRSQDLHLSSCCISSWHDCSDTEGTKVEEYKRGENGEWNNFWANYNNSIAKVPMKSYYDQCPTPYRTENIDLADLDFSTDGSKKRSPENSRSLNNIIRNEGLHLTPRETQNIIKCAHILGNVLTKAIERRTKEKDQEDDKVQELEVKEELEAEKEIKKKQMTLNLKETVIPLEVKEEKRSETVTTQTDISLPNTKSAPKIFEKILRQLSKSSLEEGMERLLKKPSIDKDDEKSLSKKPSIDKDDDKTWSKKPSIDKDDEKTLSKKPSIDKDDEKTFSKKLSIDKDEEKSLSMKPSIDKDDEKPLSKKPSIDKDDEKSLSKKPSIVWVPQMGTDKIDKDEEKTLSKKPSIDKDDEKSLSKKPSIVWVPQIGNDKTLSKTPSIDKDDRILSKKPSVDKEDDKKLSKKLSFDKDDDQNKQSGGVEETK